MKTTDTTKRVNKTGILAAAIAEVQKEQVKEATNKLVELHRNLTKAQKVVRNIQREIDDYMLELQLDDPVLETNDDA